MPAACCAFSLGLAAEQEHREQQLVRESILGRRASASGPRAPLLQPAPRVPGARLGQGEGRAHGAILPASRCSRAGDQSAGSLQTPQDVNVTLAVTQQPCSLPSLPLPTADQLQSGTVIWGWWHWALPRAGKSRDDLAELEAALTLPQASLCSCLHAVGSSWR